MTNFSHQDKTGSMICFDDLWSCQDKSGAGLNRPNLALGSAGLIKISHRFYLLTLFFEN